jgi:hypothetical protein
LKDSGKMQQHSHLFEISSKIVFTLAKYKMFQALALVQSSNLNFNQPVEKDLLMLSWAGIEREIINDLKTRKCLLGPWHVVCALQ